MSKENQKTEDKAPTARDKKDDRKNGAREKTKDLPEEKGGRNGPDPVRYGDWEKDGKCVDF